jgi:predicted nuclease of predicted toxin-antitoxin system
VKALLDQNLSYRLVDVFSERFVANSQESVFLLRG